MIFLGFSISYSPSGRTRQTVPFRYYIYIIFFLGRFGDCRWESYVAVKAQQPAVLLYLNGFIGSRYILFSILGKVMLARDCRRICLGIRTGCKPRAETLKMEMNSIINGWLCLVWVSAGYSNGMEEGFAANRWFTFFVCPEIIDRRCGSNRTAISFWEYSHVYGRGCPRKHGKYKKKKT